MAKLIPFSMTLAGMTKKGKDREIAKAKILVMWGE